RGQQSDEFVGGQSQTATPSRSTQAVCVLPMSFREYPFTVHSVFSFLIQTRSLLATHRDEIPLRSAIRSDSSRDDPHAFMPHVDKLHSCHFFLSPFPFPILNCSFPLFPSSVAKKHKTRKRVVRLEVRESGVHGRGVYATQFIPEGTRIIEYTGQRTSWK